MRIRTLEQAISDQSDKVILSQIKVLNELLGNYPTKTAQDLIIEDLQRENDAALEKIQQLSRALFDLGFDPTQLP